MAEYLYLIQCGEFTKIGIADYVDGRIQVLQIGNPYKLKVLKVYKLWENKKNHLAVEKVEKVFHRAFRHLRVRGEWFRLESYDFDLIDEFCRAIAAMDLGKMKRLEDAHKEKLIASGYLGTGNLP